MNHPLWGGALSKTLLPGAVLALGALLIARYDESVRPQLAVGDGVIKVRELPFGLQERRPLRFASFGFAACFSPHTQAAPDIPGKMATMRGLEGSNPVRFSSQAGFCAATETRPLWNLKEPDIL